MLVLKAIGLVVCIVVAVRWKRSRLPLALLLLLGALLLRGLQCGHDPATDPRSKPVPAERIKGLVDPTAPVEEGPDVNVCPDPKNCIPPVLPDAGP